MKNKLYPPRFVYDEFGIKDADFYNIDMANDNEIFLNPYEIEKLNNPWAKKATKIAVHFFETIRQLLFNNQIIKAKSLFCDYLSEPKETCLGYSKYGVSGRGIKELAEYILNFIYSDNAALCHVIKRIEDIKLFIPNISDDRVSDLYTNVIRKVLIEYTKEQCLLYSVNIYDKNTDFYWECASVDWIKTNELMYVWNGQPKLLVPKCFVNGFNYNLSKFNNFMILPDFIRKELNDIDSSIVCQNKNGDRRVSKKDMRNALKARKILLDKSKAKEFALLNPDCVDVFRYRLEEQLEKRKYSIIKK